MLRKSDWIRTPGTRNQPMGETKATDERAASLWHMCLCLGALASATQGHVPSECPIPSADEPNRNLTHIFARFSYPRLHLHGLIAAVLGRRRHSLRDDPPLVNVGHGREVPLVFHEPIKTQIRRYFPNGVTAKKLCNPMKPLSRRAGLVQCDVLWRGIEEQCEITFSMKRPRCPCYPCAMDNIREVAFVIRSGIPLHQMKKLLLGRFLAHFVCLRVS
ncbi:hypothetical protein C8035_v003956 [Colletotrichum spinosum]|uniref:Uncharacterized protein n=1 Tax=Colletotrichum spinosum TaxID=1347390 RepID=A0A4R8Q1G7_9PEZI|nr:hypothetical protein C8035_v003956 [Colletotrichum spinosum]